jgi:hypothetical protein
MTFLFVLTDIYMLPFANHPFSWSLSFFTKDFRIFKIQVTIAARHCKLEFMRYSTVYMVLGKCKPERRYTRVAFAPCLAVVYTFLPIKVLSLVFRGVISSPPPCYIGKYTMPSPNRREELIADTATLVYLLFGASYSRVLRPHSY